MPMVLELIDNSGNSRSDPDFIKPDLIISETILPVIKGATIPAASQATPRLAKNSANNFACSLESFIIEINLTWGENSVNVLYKSRTFATFIPERLE